MTENGIKTPTVGGSYWSCKIYIDQESQMMKNKCIRVSKSKYRVVISEILPYERPIFFSNRFFSRFLKYYGVEISDDRLVATKHKDTPGLALFLRFIGGEKKADRPCFQY